MENTSKNTLHPYYLIAVLLVVFSGVFGSMNLGLIRSFSISAWALMGLVGLIMLLEMRRPALARVFLRLTVFFNSVFFWLIGEEGYPLFIVFGSLMLFLMVFTEFEMQTSRLGSVINTSLVVFFFISLQLAPKLPISGFELEYSRVTYYWIVGINLSAIVLLRVIFNRSLSQRRSLLLQNHDLIQSKSWYTKSFSMLVHNIKNSLMVIEQRIQLEQIKQESKKEVVLSEQSVQIILSKTKEMFVMTSEFLKAQKATIAGMTSKTAVTLSDFLENEISALGFSKGSPLVKISRSKIKLIEPEVFAIRHALKVFVENAYVYSGELPELTLEKDEIRIKDKGPGLSAKSAAQFGKVMMSSSSEKGSGVGVYLSYNMLAMMGWSASVVEFNNGLEILVKKNS